MQFWTAYAIALLGLSSEAFSSSGGAHHGSITDLVAPALNVGILLGVLVWKLKTPIKEYFAQKSKTVAETIDRADMRAKEVAIQLETETKKLANLSSEIKAIEAQSTQDLVEYEKNTTKDFEQKVSKLKSDSQAKIAAEKKAQLDDLNNLLLNQVISKAKTDISKNKEYQAKATAKLVQEIK